jgi:MoxR-like ATPase
MVMPMTDYPFELIKHSREDGADLTAHLANRPFTRFGHSFQADAQRFVPGDQLETAINTAIAIGEPLLITGEPGTGKTQAAYYVAYKLGVDKLEGAIIHFQVKSDSTARDLLYNFDTVRYFRDAHLAGEAGNSGVGSIHKRDYVERRALWHAFEWANQHQLPPILLIDEIDKAPRDFPNDLLHELDQMEFTVVETEEVVKAPPRLRPIVFITSNSERRLPEPFLRRCVYHHIRFDDQLIAQIVASRRDQFQPLSDDFIRMAIQRFLALRERKMRKLPGTDELLVWMRVLALTIKTSHERLDEDLSRLPYLGVLLKDRQDIDELHGSRW